jgi:hypothetical protein
MKAFQHDFLLWHVVRIAKLCVSVKQCHTQKLSLVWHPNVILEAENATLIVGRIWYCSAPYKYRPFFHCYIKCPKKRRHMCKWRHRTLKYAVNKSWKALFAILHISLTSMFIYYQYKSNAAKPIALWSQIIFPCILLNVHRQKIGSSKF